MIRIAIIEDEESAKARLLSCLDLLSKKEGIELHILHYPSGSAFIEAFSCQFDIVFMDIETPGINGMEAARIMRKKDPEVILIFVTNLAQMALEGYSVDAMDFIIKPVEPAHFLLKMERVLARCKQLLGKSITLSMPEGETIVVAQKDILYAETDGHYVLIHTNKGVLKVYGTLKEIEAKIDDDFGFARCNRSYLVNLQYVERVDKDTVYVRGELLQISRPSHKAFILSLARYLGGQRE
ncbi:MAG: response regulator transcription factor [Bacilli bacterium]|nr:response regulator transcription factor [Bacilli bacterium]